MRRWTYCIVAFLATGSGVTHADTATVASLRAELAGLGQLPNPKVPPGTLQSIDYTLDVAERIERSFPTQAASWRRRAQGFIQSVKQGNDPYPSQHGQIVPRGYRSALSTVPQGYAVYIPPNYDPARKYPLMLALHGGSSNGNLFLGVVLGNNLNWKDYSKHLYDDFTPRWTPDWIVVAPTGFGQVLWRWMGEKDVLDVLDDVIKHYSVDQERIVLSGLSNGGLGAYSIGMRHASRFSAVLALAGAPGWHQYAGGGQMPIHERSVIAAVSGYDLAQNAFNTDFRFYHGRTDTGPMRPGYVHDFEKHLKASGIPHKATWYDLGHDILYAVHKRGELYAALASVKRKQKPSEVWLVSGDYRANQQHWLTITRFESYPQLATVRASLRGSTVELKSHNTLGVSLDLRQMPLASNANVSLVIDGHRVYQGPIAPLGHVVHARREGDQWQLGFPNAPAAKSGGSDQSMRWEKQPGISGPLTDAYFGPMLHVYGTQKPADTEALKNAAERGAKGWPLWLWDFQQPVLADHEVTESHIRNAHLVLYGTPGANSVLERIAKQLPIGVNDNGVTIALQQYQDRGVGTRFIYPNPLNPSHYVIVQAAPSTQAVMAGNNLPDFLADYVIYDSQSTQTRARLVAGKRAPVAAGFFDRFWQVPGTYPQAAPPAPNVAPSGSALPIYPAPPLPPKPNVFRAPAQDPAGRVARRMADLIRGFPNLRAEIAGASWKIDHQLPWGIRAERECLRSLKQQGIAFSPVSGLKTPVATAVQLQGAIRGVRFTSWDPEKPVIVACEMADRLVAISRVLRSHDVISAEVMSSYRNQPRISFHTLGLALDLSAFRTRQITMSVLKHFALTPDHETCHAPAPPAKTARTLVGIACGIAATGRFSSVLTPNYNIGHRDHLHVDARPDDPRLFIR